MKIKGTGIRCKDKGAIKDHFRIVPDTIFIYRELGLISGNGIFLWMKLLQLDNSDEGGYAFPTIDQLEVYCNLKRSTIIKLLKNLENVGLIRIAKSNKFPNKNIYFVYLPLERQELEKQVPELFEKLEQKIKKSVNIASNDKKRFEEYKQNQHDKELQAASIVTILTYNEQTNDDNKEESTIQDNLEEDTKDMSFEEFARYMKSRQE